MSRRKEFIDFVSVPLLILIFCLFLSFSLTFADQASRFSEANELYHDGKYLEAAKIYEELAKQKPLAEIYYNLGNAYFKAKKIGLAKLNYKRASQLKPRDRDILVNLAYLDRLIEYRIDDKRNWYVRKKSEFLKYVMLSECWALALGGYLIFVVGFFVSLLMKRRLLFGKSGALAVSFVIFCSLPLLLKFGEVGLGPPAIVIEPQTEVRYGPSTSDRIAFRLVEGLEVSLSDQRKDWYRISLNDGRSGWVPQSQVTPIASV